MSCICKCCQVRGCIPQTVGNVPVANAGGCVSSVCTNYFPGPCDKNLTLGGNIVATYSSNQYGDPSIRVNTSNRGLSDGAMIAIVAGVIIVGALIFTVLIRLWRRRQNGPTMFGQAPPPYGQPMYPQPGMLQNPNNGISTGAAVGIGAAGGLVGGMLLNEALHRHNHHHYDHDGYRDGYNSHHGYTEQTSNTFNNGVGIETQTFTTTYDGFGGFTQTNTDSY